jgi:hypothetical protein
MDNSRCNYSTAFKKNKRTEQYYSFLQLAKKNNIINETFLSRVNRGWSQIDLQGLREAMEHIW